VIKRENIVRDKSCAFASRIVKVYKFLIKEQREFVLSKQMPRSDTSIGANVEEALAASSRADFVNKLNIAAKEARETSCWLRLLHDNEYLKPAHFNSLHEQNQELIKIISSILISTKTNS
jgi:four helix bundle protein